MAYFSNGSEGAVFENDCAGCLFGEDACPIAFVQINWNYEAARSENKVAGEILNHLVRQDEKTFEYKGCAMKKLLIDKCAGVVENFKWMIQHFDWANSQSGAHTEDSPELKSAKAVLKQFDIFKE